MNLNKTFVAVQDASRNMLALSDKEINQILLAGRRCHKQNRLHSE